MFSSDIENPFPESVVHFRPRLAQADPVLIANLSITLRSRGCLKKLPIGHLVAAESIEHQACCIPVMVKYSSYLRAVLNLQSLPLQKTR
jgi:hypothetical protein